MATTIQGIVMFSPTGARLNGADECLPEVLEWPPPYKVSLCFLLLVQD